MKVADTFQCGYLWLVWSYLENQINPTDNQTAPLNNNTSGLLSSIFQNMRFFNSCVLRLPMTEDY